LRDDRIRVAHLINHLGRGGSERQLVLLLRHMDRERFAHRVVVFNPSPHRVWDDELADLGVEVESLPEDVRGVARRLFYLGRRLRRWRPHVLHSWTVHDNPYAGVLGRLLGVPVRLGSLRGSLASPGLERLPAFYRFLILRSVDRLVVNSRALAAEVATAGLPQARVAVLPNCVERVAAAPADLTPLGIEAEAPVVGSVGNLRRIKSHETFVRAMAEVLPRHPRARAVIVGQALASEPGYPAEIEAEIARRGLAGRLILTGFRDDVPRLLARLSVLCLTSHSEGMPNAVLEAMAAGRPVAAVRVGGVPELVRHGWNGFLVDPGDAAGLASDVDRLLADPALAAEMGAHGRRLVVAEHDCRRAAARLASLYEEALKGRTT
jgi:glycosyltransferase involved in cell wall biosynthesis